MATDNGARPLHPLDPLPARARGDKERSSGAMSPPKQEVRGELLKFEPADVVRERRVTVRLITAVIVGGTWVRRQLPHVVERALREERLRVHLQRHAGGERIRKAHREPELLLLEVRKKVMPDGARVRRGTQRPNVVGSARVTRRQRRGHARRDLEVQLRREAEVARAPALPTEPG